MSTQTFQSKRNKKNKYRIFLTVQLLQNTLSLQGMMQQKGKLKRSHKQNKHVSLQSSTEEITLGFSLRADRIAENEELSFAVFFLAQGYVVRLSLIISFT